MSETHISIEQARQDISNLVNRIAHRGERIVLTSHGKPVAALISLEDYERLEQEPASQRMARWQAVRADQEARDDRRQQMNG